MALSDVSFVVGDGALGLQRPGEDGVCGLIASGVAVAGGVQLNQPYLITSLKSAKNLGITAEYDRVNRVALFRHITDFFDYVERRGVVGSLYIIVVDRSTTMTQMVDKDIASNAIKLLNYAQGKIRILGVTRCAQITPETLATATHDYITEATFVAGDIVKAKIENNNPGGGVTQIGSYTVQAGDDKIDIAQGLIDSIVEEGVYLGTVEISSGSQIIATAPEGTGASYNIFYQFLIQKNAFGDFSAAFSGGVDASVNYTITNGLDSDIKTCIPKAQQLAAEMFNQKAPISVFVEGYALGSLSGIGSFVNLKEQESPKVHLFIHQDKKVANAAFHMANYAAIGLALGVASVAVVNAPISWVEQFNLEDAAKESFLTPSLSSGILMVDVSKGDQEQLNTLGYIFARTYTMTNGCYFSDTCSCTEATSDFSNLENNRVVDKVVRIDYVTLVPKLNSPQQVDTATGRLAPEVCKYFETLCDKATSFMGTRQEVSAIRHEVDPEQNFLSTNKLQIKARVTPTGKAKEIEVDIAMFNPSNPQ